jgi:hypothetical protein
VTEAGDIFQATFDATDQHGVLILDSDTLSEVAAFHVEEAFYLRGFSPDGRYAYIETPTGPPRIATTLRVVDVGDGHVVSERVVDGYVADLLLNPSGGRAKMTDASLNHFAKSVQCIGSFFDDRRGRVRCNEP